ncbi:MAG TPA: RHS repeat-associated core domain-containing protein, partial [Candidatus Angelobacter sp.]|nr:RHS repeat-associated core domain-containing protein [Candidatus Angelobacter sp.]
NYALFRYHAPGQGRFMSPDKMSGGMSAPQSLNRYSYTTNDPVNGIDSLGLYTITVCTVFGHIVKHETSPTETIIDNVICTTFSLDFGLFGGTGGGGGGVGEVTDALKRLKKLLDPKCITFLNSKGVDALGYIDSLIQFADQGGIAVKDMPGIITGGGPEKNAGSGTNTILSIDHAVTGHDGVPLTVNGLGAFFNKTYGESKLELTTDHGKINGGGIQAQLFIMLHEVAHGTEVIQPDKGNQPQINANDDTLEKECKDTVKSIKKEK